MLVVSRVPLPNYRADLDDRHGSSQRQISMSATTETRVENMLANIRGAEPSSSSSPQISKGNAADKATLPRSSWGQATPQGKWTSEGVGSVSKEITCISDEDGTLRSCEK